MTAELRRQWIDRLASLKPAIEAHRRLKGKQEQAIPRAITDTPPDQAKRPLALRTRAAIGELIERKCRDVLPVRNIGYYLARWGFTAQKPITRVYGQRP